MSSIVGTWKLLRATARDAAGAALPAPYGPQIRSEFALVARDLAGESFLDGIPLARRIAAATVEAFEQR